MDRAARGGDARLVRGIVALRPESDLGAGGHAPPPARDEELHASKGRRILVAEDETLSSEERVDALERTGAEPVGPVTTVEGALRIIAGPAPALSIFRPCPSPRRRRSVPS